MVATAAIRRAANGAELVAAIADARRASRSTSCSGEDEARLAFHGATRTLDPPPAGTLAVVDVGGGSTEIAIGTLAGGVTWARSFAVGSSSLARRAARPTRPTPETWRACARARARRVRRRRDPARRPTRSPSAAAPPRCPSLVGPVLDAPALDRALGVLAGAPGGRGGAPCTGSPRSGRSCCPPASWCSTRRPGPLGGRPLRIGRGGLREGVVLELAGALSAVAKAEDIEVAPATSPSGVAGARIVRVRARRALRARPRTCSTRATSSACTTCASPPAGCARCSRSSPRASRRASSSGVLRDVKALADALGERRDPDVHIDALAAFARALHAGAAAGRRSVLIAEQRERQAAGNEVLAAALAARRAARAARAAARARRRRGGGAEQPSA